MRIVIVGAGRVGLGVAHYLSRNDHDVIIIDRSEEACRKARDAFGLVALSGDGADAAVLAEAELSRAEVVVAMLPRDADNLAVALLAAANKVERVIVRMRDPHYRPVYEAARVSQIISETEVFAGALAVAVQHSSVEQAMLLGKGESIAFEVTVNPRGRASSRAVRDLAADPGFPGSCVLAGVFAPDGSMSAPRGDTVVEGGAKVLLVTGRTDFLRTINFFCDGGPKPPPPKPSKAPERG